MAKQSRSGNRSHPVVLRRDDLDRLIGLLLQRGFAVIGPTVRDGAIVYDRIDALAELPAGWTDSQGPGNYRLERREDKALFGYASSPTSWKRFLNPPTQRLLQIERRGDTYELQADTEAVPRYAFLGVRACDLTAIALQDRVFIGGPYRDPGYQKRRASLFVVAVNCGAPAATCFCASMGTGPAATSGFDLLLTELIDGEHRFLVQTGSDAGAELLDQLPHRPAEPADLASADALLAHAAAAMQRSLQGDGIKDLLYARAEHPRWQQVATRCLACTNCTMVCPTCFCTTVEDTSDLRGAAQRWRKWDSCFTESFSYIHGGSVRTSIAARYRQWLTHKLASWWDQFGSSGCVGCGRCITWCPAGIDLTEEVRALREPEVEADRHGH